MVGMPLKMLVSRKAVAFSKAIMDLRECFYAQTDNTPLSQRMGRIGGFFLEMFDSYNTSLPSPSRHSIWCRAGDK
jgi:hypothetical protein